MAKLGDKRMGRGKQLLLGAIACGLLCQMAASYMAGTDELRGKLSDVKKRVRKTVMELAKHRDFERTAVQQKRKESSRSQAAGGMPAIQKDEPSIRSRKEKRLASEKKELEKKIPTIPFRIDQIIGSSVVIDQSLYEEGDKVGGWKVQKISGKRKWVTLKWGELTKRVYVQ